MAENRRDNQGDQNKQSRRMPDQENLGQTGNKPGSSGGQQQAKGADQRETTGVRDADRKGEKFGQFAGQDADQDRTDLADDETAL